MFIIMFAIALAQIYIFKNMKAFAAAATGKPTQIVKLRQEGSFNYVGVNVNGKVIIAMYDIGFDGDLIMPKSVVDTIPGLTLVKTAEGGRSEYSGATVQIGDGPPLQATIMAGGARTVGGKELDEILMGPRLVAASGYTPVLTQGDPRLVPVGMSVIAAAIEVPLRKATEEENPSHIPIITPHVKINGKTIERMHYDTGASVTFILKGEADRLGIVRNKNHNATVTMQVGDSEPFSTTIAVSNVGFNTISTEDAQKAGYTPIWSATGQPRLVPKGTRITADVARRIHIA